MTGASSNDSSLALVVLLLALVIGVTLGLVLIFSRQGRARSKGARADPRQNRVTPGTSPNSRALPRLVGIEGASAGKEFPLDKPQLSIGRASGSDILLDAPLVSRNHALIISANGQYLLIDDGSTNGSYVNEQRVQRHALQSGDRIQFGALLFRFENGSAATPAPPVTPIDSPLPSTVEPAPRGYDLQGYRITETIGGGGAATVYKGYSLTNNAPVAVKVLHAADPLIRQKFQVEGLIGKSLRHPHIAEVYDYGDASGTRYIVMEYVDFGSLRQRLAHGRPAPTDFIIAAIGQTCEALSYAHSHNPAVIHRDIKPENILISSRDGIKVVDFGIAKLANAAYKTSTGVRIGTPYYMSPEQARGVDVVPASDVYSLGIVLYEMLTGTWPFEGAPMEVVHKHLTEPPMPPRQIDPAVSPLLEMAVMRALEKRADRRFQDALDFANAIGYRPGMALRIPAVAGLQTADRERELTSLPPHVSPPVPALKARLDVYEGASRKRAIPLQNGVLWLGRSEINPADTEISRKHLKVYPINGQLYVEDASSLNGTFLNKQRLAPNKAALLRKGDILQTGKTLMRFEQ